MVFLNYKSDNNFNQNYGVLIYTKKTHTNFVEQLDMFFKARFLKLNIKVNNKIISVLAT